MCLQFEEYIFLKNKGEIREKIPLNREIEKNMSLLGGRKRRSRNCVTNSRKFMNDISIAFNS